ncbi:hypothetical protein GCM10022380_88530 [Amycolatopsis tucumanensis]|uniref:Uncharacterized protein n=1 Tax=Amycolatopsis tucumanensis TaxID=401106 RepID=A0ABP7JYS7_9PSEU
MHDGRDLGEVSRCQETGPGGPGHDRGHEKPRLGEGKRGQRSDDLHGCRIEPDFFGSFAQRRGDGAVVVWFHPAPREDELPRVVREVGGAFGEQDAGARGGPGEQREDCGGPQDDLLGQPALWGTDVACQLLDPGGVRWPLTRGVLVGVG